MERRVDLGRRGEELAVSYLRERGYSILARNFRCAMGEIDIVASTGDQLVFVEVRTRSGSSLGSPIESVRTKKLQRIAKTALYYMRRSGLEGARCRFDVVTVTPGARSHENWSVTHLPNAWEDFSPFIWMP